MKWCADHKCLVGAGGQVYELLRESHCKELCTGKVLLFVCQRVGFTRRRAQARWEITLGGRFTMWFLANDTILRVNIANIATIFLSV